MRTEEYVVLPGVLTLSVPSRSLRKPAGVQGQGANRVESPKNQYNCNFFKGVVLHGG